MYPWAVVGGIFRTVVVRAGEGATGAGRCCGGPVWAAADTHPRLPRLNQVQETAFIFIRERYSNSESKPYKTCC